MDIRYTVEQMVPYRPHVRCDCPASSVLPHFCCNPSSAAKAVQHRSYTYWKHSDAQYSTSTERTNMARTCFRPARTTTGSFLRHHIHPCWLLIVRWPDKRSLVLRPAQSHMGRDAVSTRPWSRRHVSSHCSRPSLSVWRIRWHDRAGRAGGLPRFEYAGRVQ